MCPACMTLNAGYLLMHILKWISKISLHLILQEMGAGCVLFQEIGCEETNRTCIWKKKHSRDVQFRSTFYIFAYFPLLKSLRKGFQCGGNEKTDYRC